MSDAIDSRRLGRIAANDNEPLDEGHGLRIPEQGPLKVSVARRLLDREAAVLESVCRRLRRIGELLPESEDQEAMAEDLIPHDVPTYMASTIDYVTGDYLAPASAALREAAAANDDSLRRQLEEKRARLGA